MAKGKALKGYNAACLGEEDIETLEYGFCLFRTDDGVYVPFDGRRRGFLETYPEYEPEEIPMFFVIEPPDE